MTARIDHGVTSGTFSLDGQTFDVDNNVWVVGDDAECLVIDAPHNVDEILAIVGDRRLIAIVCTHAHDDHVRVAPALADRTGAQIMLHPDDKPVWQLTHPDREPDAPLADGDELIVGGTSLRVIHTPGHAPGAVCLYAPELGVVVQWRHPLQRRAGRHWAILLRLPDDHRVHQAALRRAAR